MGQRQNERLNQAYNNYLRALNKLDRMEKNKTIILIIVLLTGFVIFNCLIYFIVTLF